jgi:ActR/RegA family two-component response regulator
MLPNAVLVVDDEALVIDVVAAALTKKRLEVFTASSVAEAIAVAKRRRFACALVDKNLADGSGLEVIEYLRTAQPFCASVVMTGYPNADAILKALRLGAVDFLEKPFPHLAVVQEKIVALIARQQLLVERDALVTRVQELQARGGQEDFQETAQIALLQQALETAQEELRLAREKSSAEHELVFEALKHRQAQLVTAMRQAAEGVARLLENQRASPELERELRDIRRSLTRVLEDAARPFSSLER